MPFLLIAAFILFLLLSFLTNRQKKKVADLNEKPTHNPNRDERRDEGLF
jgi:large-conductance mechanosensitive channel